MSSINRYLGHTKRELQSLKRANKADPVALGLIAQAFEALKPPFKAGRLTNVQVSDLAELLNELVESSAGVEQTPEVVERLAKANAILSAIAPFKVGYVAPAPPPAVVVPPASSIAA